MYNIRKYVCIPMPLGGWSLPEGPQSVLFRYVFFAHCQHAKYWYDHLFMASCAYVRRCQNHLLKRILKISSIICSVSSRELKPHQRKTFKAHQNKLTLNKPQPNLRAKINHKKAKIYPQATVSKPLKKPQIEEINQKKQATS